jgi:hypothetical protein
MKYGLHKNGDIVKIKGWSVDIEPQEIHLEFKGKNTWCFKKDLMATSSSKRKLRKIRKLLNESK